MCLYLYVCQCRSLSDSFEIFHPFPPLGVCVFVGVLLKEDPPTYLFLCYDAGGKSHLSDSSDWMTEKGMGHMSCAA